MSNDPKILLDNLHDSFMDLHNERMKLLNNLLENVGKDYDPEKDETSEKLDQLAKDLEDLLK